MKIVLTTTLVALLAIGLLGINYNSSNNINNAFAQEGAMTPGGMNDTMGNESSTTTTSEDKSIPEQIVTNATLVYAMEHKGNDTYKQMNATLPMNIMEKNNTSSN